MITVKDFQIRTIQDLVENKLSEVLEKSFPPSTTFSFKSSYSPWRNEIIKELERRGFKNIDVYEDSYWLTFSVDVDMKKEDKKEVYCPLVNGEFINDFEYCSNIDKFCNKYKTCNEKETEEFLKPYFHKIDEQFQHEKRAELLLTSSFINDPKPIDEDGVHYDIHWYWIMKVLQKKYGYVTMKRLDKNFNSLEEFIESHSRIEIINNCPKICLYKFFIYKKEKDYKNDFNGSVMRLEDLENFYD